MVKSPKNRTNKKTPSTGTVPLLWRRQRDSNPRGLAPKRFSRPPRYDRFDMPAYEIREPTLPTLAVARLVPFRKYSCRASRPRRCALRNSANGKPPCRLFSEVSYEPSPSAPCVEDFASPKTPPRGVFDSLTQRATLVGITRRT